MPDASAPSKDNVLKAGLVLTEVAFATRDQHAFPHVNFYVADAELGARLEPGAEMAFRLGDNPLTHITVNSRGAFPTPLSRSYWRITGPEMSVSWKA